MQTTEIARVAAPPADACEKAYTVLKACPAVASVAINDENGEPLTLDKVKAMHFLPVEASMDEEAEPDEVAEAVLALQEKTAQQEQDVA